MKKITLLSLATLSLLHANIDLGNIEVTTPSNTTQNLSTTTSAIDILTAQMLKEKEFINVAEALKSLGGVDIQSTGGVGTQATITIDGLSGKNVLILIDGISYNDPSTINNTSPLEHLLLDNIERIEIVKGAQSALWGSNASGGVVNIITKNAAKGTHGSLHLKAGSFGTQELGLNLSHRNEIFYINLSHDTLTSNSFTSILPQGEDIDSYEDDGYTNHTTMLKTGVKLNANNQLDLLYKMIDATLESDPFGDANGSYDVKTKDRFYHVNYTNQSNWGELNLYLQKSTFSRSYLDELWGTPKYDGELKEIGAKFNRSYTTNAFLVIGALTKEYKHLNDLNEKYSNSSFYATNSNQWGDTTITQSLRVDNYDKFEDKTTFKLGVKHNFTKDLSLSANYGSAYNVPTLYQLYAPASDWGNVGNSNLKPESLRSFDIALNYQNLSLRYFNHTIEDRIDYGDGYINSTGESKIKGYEASYKQSLLENLFFNISYIHNDAKDANNEEILRVAKDSVKMGINYYLNRLHISVNYRYLGSKKDIKYNADYSSQIVQNGKYSVVDAVINYELDNKSKIYLKANNIFDTQYQEFYGYASSPRAIYVGIRVEF